VALSVCRQIQNKATLTTSLGAFVCCCCCCCCYCCCWCRLDTQTLRDIVMAHKLCTHAMHQVQLQRRGLLLQLGASLRDSISNDQRR
jgi:hypothetical protein